MAKKTRKKSTSGKKAAGKSKGATRAVGKTSGFGVAATWAKLLIENESLAKSGAPLNDDALVKRMGKEFPEKAESTTITRASMVRGTYNKGTAQFLKAGPSGVPGRPTSYRYVDGKRKEPRANASASGKKGGSQADAKKKKRVRKSKKRASA